LSKGRAEPVEASEWHERFDKLNANGATGSHIAGFDRLSPTGSEPRPERGVRLSPTGEW